MFQSNHLKKIVLATLVWIGLFVAVGVFSPTKVSALGCYPPSTAANFNATVMVRVVKPDGTFLKWSSDFTFTVNAADPKPFGNKWHVPDNGIAWPGKPGFPTNAATFTAKAGGEGTDQCTALDGKLATTMIFGDGNPASNQPYLACNWGTWGGGVGNEHGLAFYFSPVSVNDAGAPGYWVPGRSGYVEPGGLRDANNQSAIITFEYRLTSNPNPPEGFLEQADCNAISGWARDLDGVGGITEVHLYFDDPNNPNRGVNLGKTNIYRNDSSLGGNYGFKMLTSDPRIPVDFYTGRHTVYAYGIDVNGSDNRQLTLSPKSFGPCPPSNSSTNSSPNTDIDDEENPRAVTFTASVTQNSPNYTITVTRKFYIIRSGDTTASSPVTIAPDQVFTFDGSKNDFNTVTINNPQNGPYNLKVGDQICTSVTVDKPSVTIGFGGIAVGAGPKTEVSCKPFSNKPYVMFDGSDVKAGGSVAAAGADCDAAAGIATFRNTSNLGSSTQLAAFALGLINKPSLGIGLTTAVKSSVGGNPGLNGLTQENFGTYGGCTHDFYGDKSGEAWDGIFAGKEGKFFADRSITLGRENIVANQHVFLYVDGDVDISENITLEDSWTGDRTSIPVFYLVATGNINIAPTVKQLDGVYIAQNTVAGKGEIRTCAVGINPVKVTDMYNICGEQLVVNGAFIAKKVNFGRAYGSLRNAGAPTPDAVYATGGPAKGCTTKIGGHAPTPNCAAEVFRYTPSLYLGLAPEEIGTETSGITPFMFVTSLPPVL